MSTDASMFVIEPAAPPDAEPLDPPVDGVDPPELEPPEAVGCVDPPDVVGWVDPPEAVGCVDPPDVVGWVDPPEAVGCVAPPLPGAPPELAVELLPPVPFPELPVTSDFPQPTAPATAKAQINAP